MRPEFSEPTAQARYLVRAGSTVSLSTCLARDHARPHSSLALAATTMEGDPLLLLSDLAVHTQNLGSDPRIALLYDARDGGREPLSGNRVCVMGKVIATTNASDRERYLRRYPDAVRYAALADFRMYRVRIDCAHIVAGFGAIHWLTGTDLAASDRIGLAAAESRLLASLNADFPSWPLPGDPGPQPGWKLIGIDPEGADFLGENRRERFPFTRPLESLQQAESCLRELGQP